MFKNFKHLAITAALSTVSGVVLASPYCPSCQLGGGSSGGAQNPGLNTTLIQTTSFQTVLDISTMASSRAFRHSGPPRATTVGALRSGIAAGGASNDMNAWGSTTQGTNEDTKSTQAVKNDSENYVLGFDYQLNPSIVVGVSVSSDDSTGSFTSITTRDSRHHNKGYSVAPYVAWQINGEWVVDATAGFGEGKLTMTGLGFSGKADSDRMFGGVNLSYTRWMNNWQFLGKGSYLYAEEEYGESTGTFGRIAGSSVTNKLGQIRLGGQAAYWYGNGIQPYVGLTLSRDVTAQPKKAAGTDYNWNAWTAAIGVNFYNAANTIYGGLSYSSETRDHVSNDIWSANVNFRF